MQKLKRNMKIEKEVKLSEFMSVLLDYKSPKAQIEYYVKDYKRSKWEDRTFDDKDVDQIIETIKSLSGYSPERFLASGSVFGLEITKLKDEEAFDFFLQIAYIYLSMVNPDLFEDYEEEKNNV